MGTLTSSYLSYVATFLFKFFKGHLIYYPSCAARCPHPHGWLPRSRDQSSLLSHCRNTNPSSPLTLLVHKPLLFSHCRCMYPFSSHTAHTQTPSPLTLQIHKPFLLSHCRYTNPFFSNTANAFHLNGEMIPWERAMRITPSYN